MSVEVRKIETEYGETGVGVDNRVETTYELGFATLSGGWVRFASVPSATVDNIEAAAKAVKDAQQAAQPDPAPAADSTSTVETQTV